ncbi:MAG: response regulator transcription factor [Alphaproteobacteria bacterium]
MRQLVVLEPSRLVREGISHLLAEHGYAVVEQTAVNDPDQDPVSDDSIDLVLSELPGPRYDMTEWLKRIAAFYPKARIVLLTGRCDDPDTLREALACGAFGYIDKDLSADAVCATIDAVLHGQIVYPRELRDCLVGDGRARAGRAAPAVRVAVGESVPAVRIAAVGNVVDLRQPNGTAVHAGPVAAEAAAPRVPAPSKPALAGAGRLQQFGLSHREDEILRHVARGHANKIIANELNISEATVKSHLKSLLRKLNFTNRTQAAIWAVSQYGSAAGGMDPGARTA